MRGCMQRAKCVSDLFYHHDQTIQQSVVQWISSLEGAGVMMVLDGYDELSSHLQTTSIFADIVKGEVLTNMTVLISSRPSANQNIHHLCHSQRCQYIEVIGFGKEEIQQYVDVALEDKKELRDQLKTYLEHHPHIHGLMYIPLNCAIIVKIFRDEMKNKSQPPQTHTEVYQLLIKTVLQRHEEKSVKPPPAKKRKSKPSRYPWLGDVSEETISQLLVLSKLAYDGIKEDRLIFRIEDGALETLDLLQKVQEQYLESSGSSFSYHFTHKIVQEFMAALYVSSLPPGERAKFVSASFGKSNMIMLGRFMAGLTKLQTGLTKFQKSESHIQHILSSQEDGRRLIESLHWLFEARDPDFIQKIMGDRKGKLKLDDTALNPFDFYVLGYCIANSKQLWSLDLVNCYINAECMKMLKLVENGKAFNYINAIDLGGNGKLECEGARVIGLALGEKTAITSLGLRRSGLGSEGLCEMCRAVGMNITVTSLDLSLNTFDNQSTASLGTMLSVNKVLTSLDFRHCKLDSEGLSKVCRAVEMNSKLTSLDLSFNKFDERAISSLGTMLRENKSLTSLGLVDCGLGPEGLFEVYCAVKVNTTLTSLDVSGNKFGDHSVAGIVAMLKENKVLTYLRLDVAPKSLFDVCSAVGMNTALTSLDLSFNKFDDRSIASLGTMLRENQVLKTLALMDCGIGPDGLCKVCSAVGMNSTLTSLDLSFNKFDTQSITSLGTMLRENKVLTSLGLGGCTNDPGVFCVLLSAVRKNTTLTSLNLSGNNFDDQSIASVVLLLSNNKILQSLEVRGCGLDDDAICSLAKGLEHSKLKKLYLRGNTITAGGATKLGLVLKHHPTLTKEMVEVPKVVREML